MQIIRFYGEAILVIGLALALALFVDWVVPTHRLSDSKAVMWGWLTLQLAIDVTIILVMLYVFDYLGILDQSQNRGVAVFVLFTTVFFIAQAQLADRLHQVYAVRSRRPLTEGSRVRAE